MLGHYFTVAVRNLLKYKTQNIICILGLAVGILCFTVCLYCTRFVHSTNNCFPNYERITELKMNKGEVTFSGGTIVSEELRQMDMPHTSHITCIPFVRNVPYNVHISDKEILPYDFRAVEIDTAFNAVYRLDIIAGSWESAALGENNVIMSRSTAEKVFGSAEKALGSIIVLGKRLHNPDTPKDGGVPYTIAAIMEDIPQNNTICFMNHIDILRLNDTEGFLRSKARNEVTGARTFVMLQENSNPRDLTNHLG